MLPADHHSGLALLEPRDAPAYVDRLIDERLCEVSVRAGCGDLGVVAQHPRYYGSGHSAFKGRYPKKLLAQLFPVDKILSGHIHKKLAFLFCNNLGQEHFQNAQKTRTLP